jgi:hypothetical protein
MDWFPIKGDCMKVNVIAFLVLLAYVGGVAPTRAADSCKECRDFQRACLTAHSKAACKTDYDICIKHCKEK